MAAVPATAGVRLNNNFPPSVTSTKYFTSPLQGRTGIAFRRGSVMCYRVVGAEQQVHTADLGHREERYLKSIGLCFCFQCRIRTLQRIHAAIAGLNQHNQQLHCLYPPIVLSTPKLYFFTTYFQASLVAYVNYTHVCFVYIYIYIYVRIIKEMPGSVESGTLYIYIYIYIYI